MSTRVTGSDEVDTAYGKVCLSPLISEDSYSCSLLWPIQLWNSGRVSATVVPLMYCFLAPPGSGRPQRRAEQHTAQGGIAQEAGHSICSHFVVSVLSGLLSLFHLCHKKTTKSDFDTFGSPMTQCLHLLCNPEFFGSVQSLNFSALASHLLSVAFPSCLTQLNQVPACFAVELFGVLELSLWHLKSKFPLPVL